MREIKFRGREINSGEWVYGHYTEGAWIDPTTEKEEKRYLISSDFLHDIDPDTLGQFTGMYDKNGKEIYEEDIVEYHTTESYCINPDCEPQIRGYGTKLCKKTFCVQFTDGAFGIDEDNGYPFVSLSYLGITKEDLEELKEWEEKDAYFDTNGYNLDDSIGIKVIGNIFDTPELMKGGKV